MTARRLLLISVVRPTLEYGSEVWKGNKAQAAALESVMIGGAKSTLGCSSRTCNEAVRGDMGLDSLQGRRDKAKLKWWCIIDLQALSDAIFFGLVLKIVAMSYEMSLCFGSIYPARTSYGRTEDRPREQTCVVR